MSTSLGRMRVSPAGSSASRRLAIQRTAAGEDTLPQLLRVPLSAFAAARSAQLGNQARVCKRTCAQRINRPLQPLQWCAVLRLLVGGSCASSPSSCAHCPCRKQQQKKARDATATAPQFCNKSSPIQLDRIPRTTHRHIELLEVQPRSVNVRALAASLPPGSSLRSRGVATAASTQTRGEAPTTERTRAGPGKAKEKRRRQQRKGGSKPGLRAPPPPPPPPPGGGGRGPDQALRESDPVRKGGA
jgi:hypothetical protein